jgi:anti-sigma factor RsiW
MAKSKRANPPRTNDSCKRITDLIFAYLTDRLDSRLKREFERHLRICPDCVSFLNTYKKTIALGGIANAGEIPFKVRANVLAFLRRKIHRIAGFFFVLAGQAVS